MKYDKKCLSLNVYSLITDLMNILELAKQHEQNPNLKVKGVDVVKLYNVPYGRVSIKGLHFTCLYKTGRVYIDKTHYLKLSATVEDVINTFLEMILKKGFIKRRVLDINSNAVLDQLFYKEFCKYSKTLVPLIKYHQKYSIQDIIELYKIFISKYVEEYIFLLEMP